MLTAQPSDAALARMAADASRRMGPAGFVTSQTRKMLPAAVQPMAKPAVMNYLTMIADNVEGLPCGGCVSGFPGAIGINFPLPNLSRGVNYSLTNWFVDNTYTGSCTWSFVITSSTYGGVVAYTQATFSVAPDSIYQTSTSLTLPTPAAIAGSGVVAAVINCGGTNYTSWSPIYIQ